MSMCGEQGVPRQWSVTDHAFTQMGVREMTTPTGHTLQATALQNLLLVRDVDNPEYFFSAIASEDDVPESVVAAHGAGRALMVGVRTRANGIWHPNLHARGLYDQAVKYFDAQEEPLKYVQDLWVNCERIGTANYDCFFRELAGNPAPTQEQLHHAAYGTWTGDRALDNGFHQIVDLSISDGPNGKEASIVFARPTGG